MPANSNARTSIRTRMKARLRVFDTPVGEFTAITGNVSDGGICLISERGADIPVGSLIKVQILDMPVEAEVKVMEVVWSTASDMGLRFTVPLAPER